MPEITLVSTELVGIERVGTRLTVLVAGGGKPPIPATLVSDRFTGNFSWEKYGEEDAAPDNFPLTAEDAAHKAMLQLSQAKPHPDGYTVPGRTK
jgi:hypothetical protein